MIRSWVALFSLLPQLVWANSASQDIGYLEKVYYSSATQSRAVYRETRAENQSGFQEWRLNQNGVEVVRSTQIVGMNNSVQYSVPALPEEAQWIGNYMDSVSAITPVQDGLFTMALTLPWIADPNKAAEAFQNHVEDVQRSAQRANTWAIQRIAERKQELENRQAYIENLENGVARLEAGNQQRLAQNLTSLLSSNPMGNLVESSDQARRWSDFLGTDPQLESIRVNEIAVELILEQIMTAAESERWQEAMDLASDLSSPLNVSNQAAAQRESLKNLGWTEGVATNQSVFNPKLYPPRKDAYLEDARIRTLNSLQARTYTRSNFYSGIGRPTGRAVLLYLKASYEAELSGNTDLARTYAAKAQAFAQGEGILAEELDTEAGQQKMAQAYRAYLGEGKTEDIVSSEGLVGLAQKVLGKLSKEVGSPYALMGASHFQRALEASDAQSRRAFAELGLMAVDVALGFIPPVALLRDAYEFSTGINALDGSELSAMERAMAGAGLLSAGIASGVLRRGQVLQQMKKMGSVSDELLEQSQKGAKALRAAGFKDLTALEAARAQIRNSPDQWKALNDITKNMAEREHALPFKYATREIEATDVLNEKYIGKGWQAPYRSGDFALTGELVDPPEGMVRLFREGENSAAGSWLAHKSTIEGLTPEQIGARLNIKPPTHIVDFVPDLKKGEKLNIRSSPIGKNELGGATASDGHLQFEIVGRDQPLPDSWFKNPRPIEQGKP